MKKTALISVLICFAIAGGIFLYKKKEIQQSHATHTTTVYTQPYRPLGHLFEYFTGWSGAATTSLKYIVKTKFNGIAIGNIEKLRFDLPSSSEYQTGIYLQYYHPKGGRGKNFYDIKGGFASKEVLPESKIYYTFGNRLAARKEGLGVKQEEIPNQDVFAIVTHVRPEMCKSSLRHDVNILPWPEKVEDPTNVITFELVAMCFQHPDGWYYYLYPAYTFSYLDVFQSRGGKVRVDQQP
jgi:hypothetical protein|tara:strand:- start:2 stop:715 length:714 start_codon:yes stop_codon:yes gene_type:complete